MTEPLYRVYEQQEVGGRYFSRLTLAQAQELFSNMVEAGHDPVMDEISWRATHDSPTGSAHTPVSRWPG